MSLDVLRSARVLPCNLLNLAFCIDSFACLLKYLQKYIPKFEVGVWYFEVSGASNHSFVRFRCLSSTEDVVECLRLR